MPITRLKSCPSCNKKVERSKLMIVETSVGTKVTCCNNCISYLKVRRKLS